MTTLKYFAVTLTLILCATGWSIAQAQMPALDVAIDSDQVRFVAEAQELRVEVYAPSGEMIFDSGAVTGQPIDWRMQNTKGERVADGVYLVTIQLKTAQGQVRKRIEQVVVGREQQEGKKPSSPNSPSATITGTGTTGRIAKFTNTTVIGNSVMTEASGKIGIGITTPTAFFHVKEGGSDTVVAGVSTGSGIGMHGISVTGNGVSGKSTSADGVYGNGGVMGVVKVDEDGFAAIYGKAITPGDLPIAGYFDGNVQVNGTLTKNGGSFKIDHPLDPAHKYLYHSFVESPDMMNIYNGNVTLDQNGEAVVTMPRWFNALNREFRYQLTAIGAPGPNLYIAEEVKGNHFKIAGGTSSMKVSWQVTGIRKDAWAEAHRIPVEQDKPEKERGSYLHPELFGQPEEKGVTWALNPKLMQRIKEEEREAQPQQPPAVKQ